MYFPGYDGISWGHENNSYLHQVATLAKMVLNIYMIEERN